MVSPSLPIHRHPRRMERIHQCKAFHLNVKTVELDKTLLLHNPRICAI